MIKYKVNGEYLDQFKLENFAISKAISKIGEIDLRHGDRSTSFDVPLTAKNIKILRYTPELNNYTTVNNFDRYNGQLIENDAVVSDGYYQVVKFSPTTKKASLRFYGGNSDWFDLLKDRFINEEVRGEGVEFPYLVNKFDSVRSINEILDFNEDYTWYLYNNNIGQDVDDVSAYNIGYYNKSLMINIFESVDIDVKGSLFNDVVFSKEVCSPTISIDSLINTSNENLYKGDGGVLYKNDPIPTDGSWQDVRYIKGDFDIQWNGQEFTAELSYSKIDIRATINTQRIFTPNMGNLEVRFVVNGVAESPVTLGTIDETLGRQGENINESWREQSSGYIERSYNSFPSGSTFKIQVRNTGNTSSENYFLFGFFQGRFYNNEAYISTKTEGGAPLARATSLIPKIKQTDFIKDIMVRYGVVSQYDIKTRTLTLDKLEDIENNIPNAPNWSNKIDLSKEINVDYTKILNNYAKESFFEYKEDSNDVPEAVITKNATGFTLGTGVINIQNDFLSDEKTVYKSPFSSTVQKLSKIGDTDGLYIPVIPYYLNGEFNEVEPRLLLVETFFNVININNTNKNSFEIKDEFNIPRTINNVNYAFFSKVSSDSITFDNILNNREIDEIKYNASFGNSISFNDDTFLERNYNLYIKILNNPFYVSLNLNLSSLDVQSVDFLTPIYLEYKYDSGYYYIDSIEQYKGDGSTTKVNLVKI